MSGLSNELADFLADLIRIDNLGLSFPEKGDELTACFFAFLNQVGVDHCNFGLFGIDESEGQLHELSGSLLPTPFVEEFVNELSKDAYVLLRADQLTDAEPVQQFDVGVDFLAEFGAVSPRAPMVQIETARHGMVDGRALIGKSVAGGESERYFGFAFAGDRASGRQIRKNFFELEIAAFALMNRLLPKMEADHDRFRYNISTRERDVLIAISNGLQRDAVSFRLSVSKPTVDLHLANLRRKLGAQTQAEAVAKGFRYGLL